MVIQFIYKRSLDFLRQVILLLGFQIDAIESAILIKTCPFAVRSKTERASAGNIKLFKNPFFYPCFQINEVNVGIALPVKVTH
ncbi:hypothetical protein D3C71_1715050 [compost metagenome]